MTAEPLRRLTPADVRDDAVRIGTLAKNLAEFLDLYADVHADDIHEEIVNGFEFIVATARGAAKRQKALHEWSTALADSVHADLELIEVADVNEGGDLLAPPPFGDVDIDPDEEQPW